ncbi:MAG: V-type ATP synthase subunit I [Candidatus Alkanophagales archaeon]
MEGWVMLRPVEMRELRMIVLDEHVDAVIKKLDELGCVHLTDIKEFLDEFDGLVEPSKADPALAKYSELLMRIGNVIDALRTEKEERGGIRIRSLLKPPREEVRRVKVEKVDIESIENELRRLEEVVIGARERAERARNELSELESTLKILNVLRDLGLDLDFVGEQEFVHVFVGRVSAENVPELERLVTGTAGEESFIVSKPLGTGVVAAVVVTLKARRDEVARALRMVDFEAFTPPPFLPANIEDAIREVERRKERLEEQMREAEREIEGVRRERLHDLLVMRELVQMEDTSARVRLLFGETERARVIEGWVPADAVDAVVEGVRSATGDVCAFEVRKPSRHDSRVPTLLRNPGFLKPFEAIINMYSPPSYGDIDPTIITAIIFPILFGLMFPDVGHGLLVLLLGLALMFVFKGLSEGIRQMGLVIALCGFFSMVAGALFGEFFGFSHYAAELVEESLHMHVPHSLLLDPLWFEPVVEVERMFVVSMLIGALHMGLGLTLNGVNSLLKGEVLRGVTGFVSVWCLAGALYFLLALFGLAPMTMTNLAILIAAPIVLLMILRIVEELRHEEHGQGHGGGHAAAAATATGAAGGGAEERRRSVMDLLIILIDGVIDALLEKFFRFLANTVSYGRILALALCHAALIEVFVLLTFMCLKVSAAVAALVFVGGTALVVILEAIMAGIHTVRLHFYEWFTKFYEGGGTPFSPFKFSRTYTY